MLSKNNVNKTKSIIPEGVTIEGKIQFTGPVKIDGIVDGDVISENTLIIGREGKVKSNVRTKDAVIEGRFEGEMLATGLVEIASTGIFIGNLSQYSPMLSVERGGAFRGKSSIITDERLQKSNVKIRKGKAVKLSLAS